MGKRWFVLGLIAAVLMLCAQAQTGTPGGQHRMGWTIVCPEGQTLNQDCVDKANSIFADDMATLNAQLASAMKEEEATYSEACWDCDSVYNACVNLDIPVSTCAEDQAGCINFEMTNHAARVSNIVSSYTSMKHSLEHALSEALHACCQ